MFDLVDLFEAVRIQFYGGPVIDSTGDTDDDEDYRAAAYYLNEPCAVPE